MALRRFSIILLILLLLPVCAQAGSTGAFARAKKDYRALLASTKSQQYRDRWARVVDGFLAVANRYSSSAQAPSALYDAARATVGLYHVSRSKDDAHCAVAYYDLLVERYPKSSLADDALLLAARIESADLQDGAQAYQRLSRLVAEYPRSDMASKARNELKSLARFAPAPTSLPAASAPAAPADANNPAEVTGIRCWSNPGYTRVVIDLKGGPTHFVAKELPAQPDKGISPRLYVDVDADAAPQALDQTKKVNDGLLRQVRTGHPEPHKVRVVLDLVSLGSYKVFPLEDPFRIIIDVAGSASPTLSKGGPALSALPPGKNDGIAKILDRNRAARAPGPKIPTAPGNGNTLRRIVVDPGHGGKDPGATGPDGVHEKNVVLSIAKALAHDLRKELGCEVILTRKTDTFIPLEERAAIANKDGADLFISIHANASPDPHAHGIATYYLNFSKNRKAVEVAARENGTSLKQVGDLQRILLDLMANSKINESSRLAAEIQQSLIDNLDHHYSHINDLGARPAPFYVLVGTTMPSVLVETAFISNRREEHRLTSHAYERATAQAIARGIRDYAKALNLIVSK